MKKNLELLLMDVSARERALILIVNPGSRSDVGDPVTFGEATCDRYAAREWHATRRDPLHIRRFRQRNNFYSIDLPYFSKWHGPCFSCRRAEGGSFHGDCWR
jgi:hypothetical protein